MASEWQGRPLWHEKQPFRAAVICTTWGYSVHVVKSGASGRKNRAITVGLAIREPQQSALPPGSRDSGLTTRTCRVSAGKFAARAPCRPAARRLRVRGFLACRLATCDFQARNPSLQGLGLRLAVPRPELAGSRLASSQLARLAGLRPELAGPRDRGSQDSQEDSAQPQRAPGSPMSLASDSCHLHKKGRRLRASDLLVYGSSDRARTGDLRLERAAS